MEYSPDSITLFYEQENIQYSFSATLSPITSTGDAKTGQLDKATVSVSLIKILDIGNGKEGFPYLNSLSLLATIYL
jgi:hypothetical protein